MIIRHVEEIEPVVPDEGARGVELRKAIGEAEGAENFIMRVFRVAAGGHTPYHSHDFEHEVYVLRGAGLLNLAGGRKEGFRAGDAIYVEPGEEHQFENAGDGPLEFICVVPRRR
jgi:quercetin dioxygenase-like cupin family protein